ncbi:MAG: NAD-dependent epimerase/dehydratase family protein [Verrucomicrobiota bacterium]
MTRILVTGCCGFVGSVLVRGLLESAEGGLEVVGLDNLSRQGSEQNRDPLVALGMRFLHGDVRAPSDVEAVGPVDWVIDASANPSVLAGVNGGSRQLMETNLYSTVNLLEHCRAHGAGFILLSTSRVYGIRPLAELKVEQREGAFVPAEGQEFPPGLSPAGIAEGFSTAAPISLYGVSKLASENLALEYGETFDLPVWINRCGVLAGAGQFGKPDQGIFSFWINMHLRRRAMKYIGFEGTGAQVRDALHPRDLLPLLRRQMAAGRGEADTPRVVNLAGGAANTMSLKQLTAWCDERFGPHEVAADLTPRPFDLPWIVLDPALAREVWDWTSATPIAAILDEIAEHAQANPDWLAVSGVK